MKAMLVAFIAVTVAAVGQRPPAQSYEPVENVLARVPDAARAKQNPLEHDPEAQVAGKKLFDQHCSECHGKYADGARRGPSLRTAAMQLTTPGEVFWVVTNGVIRYGMPAWSKLPEPQRWQLVTFITHLRQDRR